MTVEEEIAQLEAKLGITPTAVGKPEPERMSTAQEIAQLEKQLGIKPTPQAKQKANTHYMYEPFKADWDESRPLAENMLDTWKTQALNFPESSVKVLGTFVDVAKDLPGTSLELLKTGVGLVNKMVPGVDLYEEQANAVLDQLHKDWVDPNTRNKRMTEDPAMVLSDLVGLVKGASGVAAKVRGGKDLPKPISKDFTVEWHGGQKGPKKIEAPTNELGFVEDAIAEGIDPSEFLHRKIVRERGDVVVGNTDPKIQYGIFSAMEDASRAAGIVDPVTGIVKAPFKLAGKAGKSLSDLSGKTLSNSIGLSNNVLRDMAGPNRFGSFKKVEDFLYKHRKDLRGRFSQRIEAAENIARNAELKIDSQLARINTNSRSKNFMPVLDNLIQDLKVPNMHPEKFKEFVTLSKLKGKSYWTPSEMNFVRRNVDRKLNAYKTKGELKNNSTIENLESYQRDLRKEIEQVARNQGIDIRTLNQEIQGGHDLRRGISENRSFFNMADYMIMGGMGGYGMATGFDMKKLFTTAALIGGKHYVTSPAFTSKMATVLKNMDPEIMKDFSRNIFLEEPKFKPATKFAVTKLLNQANKDLARAAMQAGVTQKRAQEDKEYP